MEHPNAALVRRLHRALAGGAYPTTVRRLFRGNAIWYLPGAGPLAGEHRGIEAILTAMRRFEELSGGSIRTEPLEVLAGDDHAVALLRATAARAGRRYDSLELDVYHVRDGKITELWSLAQDQRLTDEFWSTD